MQYVVDEKFEEWIVQEAQKADDEAHDQGLNITQRILAYGRANAFYGVLQRLRSYK